jgi:hypothetical protein
MPVEGEHEPSAQAWVCDQIELDEGSGGGTKGPTLLDTGRDHRSALLHP